MKTYVYRASNLKCTITFLALVHSRSQFLASAKNRHCDFLINVIINFFRRVFSEYTEEVTTSLIRLDTILPEIRAFIIGFSCTVWTKMRLLAGSLADGVLADSIIIPPRPPIPTTNNRKNHLLVNRRCRDG